MINLTHYQIANDNKESICRKTISPEKTVSEENFLENFGDFRRQMGWGMYNLSESGNLGWQLGEMCAGKV